MFRVTMRAASVAAAVLIIAMICAACGAEHAKETHNNGHHHHHNGASNTLGWKVIRNIVSETPEGVTVDILGEQEPFIRNPPKSIDSSVVEDFFESFNLLQDVTTEPAMYRPCSDHDENSTSSCPLYVASIPNAVISGESGIVYDENNHIYHDPEMFFERIAPSPLPTLPSINNEPDDSTHHHYHKLATTIQQYGHMYYHFVVETLPKLTLLKGYLDSDEDVMILMWGKDYEKMYVEALGIDESRIVYYNPEHTYSADVLLFPTPVKRITPSREALYSVRSAFGIENEDGEPGVISGSAEPKKHNNKLVYCSRKHEGSRNVANEEELLDAIRENFDQMEVVVFHGTHDDEASDGDTVTDVMELFGDAAVIMGPHGAGLSHMIFSGADSSEEEDRATVVEFQFMRDPPMMFWHLSESLGMDYWMIPVPASFWMMDDMEVSVDEVMDILHETVPHLATVNAIESSEESSMSHTVDTNGQCPRGSMRVAAADGSTSCEQCPPGTYKFQNRDSATCEPCFQGRYANGYGNTACRTCPIGTVSADQSAKAAAQRKKNLELTDRHWGIWSDLTEPVAEPEAHACRPCPEDTVGWMPGGFDEKRHCLSKTSHIKLLDDIDRELRVLDHVSPEGASRMRRAMVECAESFNATGAVNGFSGPYTSVGGFSGPYAQVPSVTGFSQASAYNVTASSGPYSSVGAFGGPDGVDCDVLNPPTMASSRFVTNSTCPTGLADVQTRQCAACDVSKAVSITTACPVSTFAGDVSEDCCAAFGDFNNGGCYCDVEGVSVADDFGLTAAVLERVSEACSLVPMSMDEGNCPAGSSMVEALSTTPTGAGEEDGGSNGGMATWALLLLIIPGVLVLILLWKAFTMCCCRRKTVVV